MFSYFPKSIHDGHILHILLVLNLVSLMAGLIIALEKPMKKLPINVK